MKQRDLLQAPEVPLPSRFGRPGTRARSVYHSRRHSRKLSRRLSLSPRHAKSRRVHRRRTVGGEGGNSAHVTNLEQEMSAHTQDTNEKALKTTAGGCEGVNGRDEEEEEEEETSVSFLKVLRLSSREWWLILMGVLGSVVDGAVYPVFAIIFGEALEVFSLPANQVVPNINKWAGLFLVLGVVSGTSVFIKVGSVWGQSGWGCDPQGIVSERELQHFGRNADSQA